MAIRKYHVTLTSNASGDASAQIALKGPGRTAGTGRVGKAVAVKVDYASDVAAGADLTVTDASGKKIIDAPNTNTDFQGPLFEAGVDKAGAAVSVAKTIAKGTFAVSGGTSSGELATTDVSLVDNPVVESPLDVVIAQAGDTKVTNVTLYVQE